MREVDSSRCADWRFLLPAAEFTRVLSLGDQPVRGARALGASVVGEPEVECDLLIGVDPAPEQLARGADALKPGGACYFEWRSARPRAMRSIRQVLETAGFVDVRLYWMWPCAIPSLWIPLDAPAAAVWVLKQRRRPVALTVWQAARALGLLRPLCATARRPPAEDARGPLGAPLHKVRGRPHWAMLAPGRDPMNKVVALVSETGGDEPVLAVKMPRVARAAEALERESSSLRALETSGATSVLGVPRLLFEHRVRGQLKAIGQSAMHGDPAYSFLRKDHSWLKQRASLWLLELAGLEPSTTRRRELGGEIIADLRSSVAEGAEQDLLTGAESIITGVDDLRLVFEQRDFSPWNVHVARDGSLVVYDWESAEPAGFPLLDLVYFLTHTAFFVAGAMKSQQFREAYRSGFVRNPSMSSCLHAHARALSIPNPYLPQLRTLTWIVHARSAAIRGDSPRTALFLDLLREEVATGEVSGVVH